LPGDYYFDYTFDPGLNPASYWVIDYTLTAHRGAGLPGEDAYFLMNLTPSGPIFYQIQGLNAPPTGSSAASPATAARAVKQSGSDFDRSNYEFKQLREYSQTQGGYTLTVRTGVWEPKQ